MVECVITIDYEIYGNGEGSLQQLVYEPAEKLMNLFRKHHACFVAFIEVAELEMIEDKGKDQAIELIKHQIRELHRKGFELGLHLHPQWYNGRYSNGRWQLDYDEYNLCNLSRERIEQIIDQSIAYLRVLSGAADYTPVSFRAGNWLFQPTRTTAKVLADRGIKVDSSVFRGGLQHQHKLDYRRALRNGYYWTFSDYVDIPDPKGTLIELPIYTRMVPFWKMLTTKRIGLQRKNSLPNRDGVCAKRLHQLRDFLRIRYPLKLDFCRMTIQEITRTLDSVIREDHKDPATFRPIVAIGHTKDLVDLETVDSFLAYLEQKEISVSTFQDIYCKCNH